MNEAYGVELMLDYQRDRRSIAFEKADPQMLRDVEDQLWWSPFVDADDVDVSVDEGIVTLTGTVESWSEWVDAQDNAYEAGAILVDNHLEIEDGDRRQ
jgi:osmotically-inducible protein OsmY